jgi:hypothetical protein
MSVAGITDWEGRGNDEDLVIGKYSLAFIEKVRERWGSPFFHAYWIEKIGGQAGDFEAMGPMLPVKAHSRLAFLPSMNFTARTDLLEHDSVAKWGIKRNGNVRIRDTAIIAPTESTVGGPMWAGVLDLAKITDMDNPLEVISTLQVDLTEWIQSMNHKCYAVCTGYSHDYDEYNGEVRWACRGLVLARFHTPLKTPLINLSLHLNILSNIQNFVRVAWGRC